MKKNNKILTSKYFFLDQLSYKEMIKFWSRDDFPYTNSSLIMALEPALYEKICEIMVTNGEKIH